jgi:carboxyl-terminal processing protease
MKFKNFLIKSRFFLLTLLSLSLFAQSSQALDFAKMKRVSRISRAVYLIQQEYYDKERVKPREMFEEGVFELAKLVPEVVPHFQNDELHFQVGPMSSTLPLSDIKSLYDVLNPISDIFAFIDLNYQGDETLEDMEYAFISGMLAKLDPHSNALPPDLNEELKTQTVGEYGGLGIVIGIRDNDLTVISPIDDTPAFRAGIQADDKILQIDDQVTTNMPINDAVDLMRGKPGAPVVLKIKSKNKDARFVKIVREVIAIVSVQSALVEEGGKKIGVVRLKSFSQDLETRLTEELASLTKQAGRELDGVILDLRNNPGGLLDQAISVSDKFLAQGDIVFTVKAGGVEEDIAYARERAGDVKVPLIVLINEGSASASEIVAGAIKNNNRGLILGEKSYGKGSVQVLYPLYEGGSMKLTISQYLTTGKESIQAVGIMPDIRVYASEVTDEYFDLNADEFFGEHELDAHLENKKFVKKRKPEATLTYFDSEKDELESRYESKIKADTDYLIKLSAKILAGAGSLDKKAMLTGAKLILEKEQKVQSEKLVKALKEKGVDWSSGQKTAKARLGYSYRFVDKKTGQKVNELLAGTEAALQVTLVNQGKEALHQVLAEVESVNPLLDNRELVFGKVAPGASVKAEVSFKIPDEMISIREDVALKIFTEKTPDTPVKKMIATHFVEKAHPRFTYSYEIIDNGQFETKGDGDGKPEPGEKVAFQVKVKNTGEGDATQAIVNLKNTEGSLVYLRKGRELMGELKAGAEKTAKLYFDVKPEFKKDKLGIEFFVLDDGTRAILKDDVIFDVKAGLKDSPKAGLVQSAPHIEVKKSDYDSKVLKLEAEVFSDKSLKDIAVFVKGRKVFYKNLEAKTEKKVPVVANLDLEDGLNPIVIQARGERDLIQLKAFSVVVDQKKELVKK